MLGTAPKMKLTESIASMNTVRMRCLSATQLCRIDLANTKEAT